jgi:hypothetical protein
MEAAGGRYRELLLESCDIIDLANLPEQDRHLAQRQLELRRLYVPLRVQVEARAETRDEFWEVLEKRRYRCFDQKKCSGSRPGSC